VKPVGLSAYKPGRRSTRYAFLSGRRGDFMAKTSDNGTHRKRRRITVLLVQSNPADSLMTKEAFKAAGVKTGVHCVSDGDEVLSYVEGRGKYTHTPLPDLIFLDLSNPSASGLNILKVIKSTPDLMHIPIVVAAGSDDPKFIRSVYTLNGNCFIRKPGELGEFVRFIETCYYFWANIVTLSARRSQKKDKTPKAVKKKISKSQLLALGASASIQK
jgi:CheY-like chemotaxis protein